MSRRTGGGLGRGGRTSDPLAVHIVPRLPRKSGCPTPATQKRRSPRDTRGTPRRTSDPLAVHIVPRLPRKSGGAQGTCTRGTPGRDPLAVHIVPRFPRKSSGAQGTPEGRQGVQCTLSHACHAKAAEPKGHQRDARAYIRPLGSAHCPTPATQKQRSPRDTRGTPGRTSDPLPVHIVPRLPRKSSGATHCQCTSSHACHAKAAEPKGHQRDARAYIRPLASAHCPMPATQKQRSPRDTRGTPGRTSDPLPVHIVPRLPRKSSGATHCQCTLSHACHAKAAQGTPEGRQGVHPTPCQCTLSHACHAKAAQGTPEGRQGVHPTPWQCTLPHACHAKAAELKGHQRDARAYIRPLGSAHCPTPATQKRE